MNKRIKELARLAYLKERIGEDPSYEESKTTELILKDLEGVFVIFGEMLIQECIDVHTHDYGVNITGSILKKHFGIEVGIDD